MNRINLGACAPSQVINLNIAVNDFSLIEIYNGDTLLNNEELDWSYSTDSAVWSCWMSYDKAGNNLFDLETDYFIRAKVNSPITKVIYNGIETNEYSTSLAKCFDFDNVIQNPNQYNPYANTEYAMGLYQQLTETVNAVVGIPIYYFKLAPNVGSKDITFKEYTLMDVEAVKQIKLIVNENQMPSSKPEFSEWGFDFSTDWETEISKTMFASAFGVNAHPMEGDLVYIPMMKRMWMVNGSYEEKNEGFMWQTTTFKVALVKYQEKGSVDLGDTEDFINTLVANKYEDLFGNDENRQSGQETVECPEYAAMPIYPVFESDAVRKYVSMSEGYFDLNAKLISSPKYNKGIVIAENMYDWTNVLNECIIAYQTPFIGIDGTLSFIITTGNKNCEGKLFNVGNIEININITNQKTILSVFELLDLELDSNATYLVYIRWSKSMNLLEMSAMHYTYPSNIPLYNLQNYHYKLDFNNIKTAVTKYDIELEQCEKKDVITYSFDGKITNIKLYDRYIDNVSELIQMYPTNQHLLINDTARKFVELPGTYTR
jgi:hypothetical protein